MKCVKTNNNNKIVKNPSSTGNGMENDEIKRLIPGLKRKPNDSC